MAIPLISGLVNLLKPIRGIIDDVTTTSEEKLVLQNALRTIELESEKMILEHDATVKSEQSKIIQAEINSKSAAARLWRPHLMYLFGAIIANNYVLVPYIGMLFPDSGIVPLELPPDLWGFLKLGVTGYIGARTVEKVGPAIASALRGSNAQA